MHLIVGQHRPIVTSVDGSMGVETLCHPEGSFCVEQVQLHVRVVINLPTDKE